MSASEAVASPLDAEDLRVRVQKRLDDFLAAQVPVLDDVSPDLAPLAEAITDLLAAASGCARRSPTGAGAAPAAPTARRPSRPRPRSSCCRPAR